MNNDIAIKVENVSKSFKLPHEKQSSLKGSLINFHKRKKGFEKQEVLKDISFEIKKGEFFGIVGRNGSGKSTLLKLLAEIYTPNNGGISINGKLTPFIELGVGFNHELTGRENVFLNGALLGFNRKDMIVMYDDIVKFAELERFMDQKLKNYSSGMQVRLAFSIAIRVNTDILVLDEVLAVGDAAFQQKCFDYFMDLKKNNRTVVLVTHDMSAVRQYCDRAIMIEKGELVLEGSPDAVAQEYQKLFINEVDNQKSSQTGNKKIKQNRWGEGGVLVTEASVVVAPNNIIIKATYKAETNIEPPIYGFTIHGPGGINILEGNTRRLKHTTESLTKGESLSVTWEVPNIFSSGNYDISMAVCDQSTTRFYDWLNEAVSFKILNETPTAGVVDPIINIIEYEKK